MKNWMNEFVYNTDLSQNRPIKDVVYESIKKTLIEHKVPAGERFIEKEYSDRLNISRTPVRESLKQLEKEGLVKYVPRLGVVVNRITKEDVIEIYKIRSSLELLVATESMKYITQSDVDRITKLLDETHEANLRDDLNNVIELFSEFNSQLYELSKMKILPNMISNLNNYLHRFRTISIEDSIRREKAILEHRQIIKSIVERDRDLSEMIIKKHLYDSLDVVLQQFNI
ncbi:MAG: GntR family transcriptional regulator [Terrisporobacter othiniensis]|uniref:GntR family transcriptional regulator n=1 Tax=Terrisporobacter petrolearius TaxID=1460447 RepID=UPI0008E99D87|nr:GntR family transcriptional regulator [Terrisporobacter petrolearius]MDU4860599.1 GntR family transcriptional regulator [Terrisporobacter othiniensis]MDU6994458.1 GntR family transcriptional regulator [Terrisporobacter othiniensis]SFJ65633.1 DNA-binding transcriptional regulator, GntR family [Terrisporobacter glycolicus]